MSAGRGGYVLRMRVYPDVAGRRAAALLHDALVLFLLVVFAWLGIRVHDTVDKLAVLGSSVKTVGDNIPLVGGSIADAGADGESSVHHLANLLGALTFGIPAVLLLWRVLPDRIDAVRRLNAAAHILRGTDEPEQQRMLAMRAAFSLPYGQLLRYTRDPLGDLAAGHYEPLVSAALDEAGLKRGRRGNSGASRAESVLEAQRGDAEQLDDGAA